MRKKYYYYTGGVLCLILSVLIILDSGILSFDAKEMAANAVGYKDHYQTDFPMPKNSLAVGTAWIPIYSIGVERSVSELLAAFDMPSAEIAEYDEYFEAFYPNSSSPSKTLRIYNTLDLIEYVNYTKGFTSEEIITDDKALEIADAFLHNTSLYAPPYYKEITRDGNEIKLSYAKYLESLPNFAFPTYIIMDLSGNITSVSHFYFEYEAIGNADIITVKQALALLPQCSENGKIHIHNYQLVYAFEDSIVVPAYRFRGQRPCGGVFEEYVNALKFR